jgi:hypothetical protein
LRRETIPAVQTRFSQFDQRLGPVTHEIRHIHAKRLESRFHQTVPSVIGAIHCHLFNQQVATGKVHEHQHQALQEGFIHRPDDRSYFAMVNAFLFPSRCGLHDGSLQHLEQASQGAGRTPHMRLKVKTAEKLADRFGPNSSFETKDKEGGHNQADEPVAAFWRFPQPRLRVAVSAIDRLEVTMHAAFGKPSVTSQLSNALLTVFSNRVENEKTFGPQSHVVGPYSEGWLKS